MAHRYRRAFAWFFLVGCGGATLDVGGNETAPPAERTNVAVALSFRTTSSGTEWVGTTMGGTSDADWARRNVGPCAFMTAPAGQLGKSTPWFDGVTVRHHGSRSRSRATKSATFGWLEPW